MWLKRRKARLENKQYGCEHRLIEHEIGVNLDILDMHIPLYDPLTLTQRPLLKTVI
jgi:hypothetical protein